MTTAEEKRFLFNEYMKRRWHKRSQYFRSQGLNCMGKPRAIRADGKVRGTRNPVKEKIITPFQKKYGMTMAEMARQKGVTRNAIWLKWQRNKL